MPREARLSRSRPGGSALSWGLGGPGGGLLFEGGGGGLSFLEATKKIFRLNASVLKAPEEIFGNLGPILRGGWVDGGWLGPGGVGGVVWDPRSPPSGAKLLKGALGTGGWHDAGLCCCPQLEAPIGLSPLSAALLHRRRRPSASHPLVPSRLPPWPILPSPTHPSFPLGDCATGAPGLSLFHCAVSVPHGGGQRPLLMARWGGGGGVAPAKGAGAGASLHGIHQRATVDASAS